MVNWCRHPRAARRSKPSVTYKIQEELSVTSEVYIQATSMRLAPSWLLKVQV